MPPAAPASASRVQLSSLPIGLAPGGRVGRGGSDFVRPPLSLGGAAGSGGGVAGCRRRRFRLRFGLVGRNPLRGQVDGDRRALAPIAAAPPLARLLAVFCFVAFRSHSCLAGLRCPALTIQAYRDAATAHAAGINASRLASFGARRDAHGGSQPGQRRRHLFRQRKGVRQIDGRLRHEGAKCLRRPPRIEQRPVDFAGCQRRHDRRAQPCRRLGAIRLHHTHVVAVRRQIIGKAAGTIPRRRIEDRSRALRHDRHQGGERRRVAAADPHVLEAGRRARLRPSCRRPPARVRRATPPTAASAPAPAPRCRW